MRFHDGRRFVALAAAVALAFLGCEGTHERPSRFRTLADLDRPDCRLGVRPGGDAEALVRRVFPRAAIVTLDVPADARVALLTGRLEAFVADEHELNVACRAFPQRFRLLDTPLEREPAAVLLRAKDEALRTDVNRVIDGLRRDGTCEQMRARWCQNDRDWPMPVLPEAPREAPELRIGTSGLVEPSTYMDDAGRLAGFDIEFARRLAFALGRRPRFVLRPDGSLEDDLRRGETDLIVDNRDEPEPPRGLVRSDGYLDSDMKVLVVDEDAPGDAVCLPRLRLFARGLFDTLVLFLFAALLGEGLARRVRGRTARALASLRWVPPPVLLLLCHGALLFFLPAPVTLAAALALWHAADRAQDPARPTAEARVALLHWTCAAGTVNVLDLAMAADLLCGRSPRALVPMLGIALAYALLARGIVRFTNRRKATT